MSIVEWMKNIWFIYALEDHTTIKINVVHMHVSTWENLINSDVCKAGHKYILCDSIYIMSKTGIIIKAHFHIWLVTIFTKDMISIE